jgi:hypothetical protein
MPNPTTSSGIRDNHCRGVVADFLRANIQSGSRLSIGSASIAKTFQKRVAAGLQSGRAFVIPDQKEQASESTDFALTTWLVIQAQ